MSVLGTTVHRGGFEWTGSYTTVRPDGAPAPAAADANGRSATERLLPRFVVPRGICSELA